MKKVYSILLASLICFSSSVVAEIAHKMGCDWQIPSRFERKSEGLWGDNTGDKGLILFKNDFFDEDIISIKIVDSIREQEKSFSKLEGGYRISVYTEHLKDNKAIATISWVVIENPGEKGVFYLSGIGAEEFFLFSESCLPNLQ